MAHYNSTTNQRVITTKLTNKGMEQMLNGDFNIDSYAFIDLTPYQLYDQDGNSDADLLQYPVPITNQFANYYFLTTISGTKQQTPTISIERWHTNKINLKPNTEYQIIPITEPENMDTSYTLLVQDSTYFSSISNIPGGQTMQGRLSGEGT